MTGVTNGANALPHWIDYDTAVAEGKDIIAKIDSGRDRLMRLGELADQVGTAYSEGRLKRFAKEIGIAACTLARCRSVFRAWRNNEAPAPRSYAVAQELQKHPDRFEIVRQNPDITKREARAIRRRLDLATRQAPDHLRAEMKRWFHGAIRRAGEAVSDAHIADGEVSPELQQAMRETVEPRLLPALRDGAEALTRLADYLEQLTEEEQPPRMLQAAE